MRGKTADLQRLFHIAKWCRKLQGIGAEMQTYEQFISKKNYRAVELSAFYIGQLGEHARTLSDEMKSTLADIPWKQIVDMRNRLIHNYDAIRTDMVWGVIADDAPALAARCLEVLRAENPDVDAELNEELIEEGVIEGGDEVGD